jgi:hypothetical protein
LWWGGHRAQLLKEVMRRAVSGRPSGLNCTHPTRQGCDGHGGSIHACHSLPCQTRDRRIYCGRNYPDAAKKCRQEVLGWRYYQTVLCATRVNWNQRWDYESRCSQVIWRQTEATWARESLDVDVNGQALIVALAVRSVYGVGHACPDPEHCSRVAVQRSS